jgi:hypothetical protein
LRHVDCHAIQLICRGLVPCAAVAKTAAAFLVK